MKDSWLSDDGLEPERYERRERPPYRFDLERRDFLRLLGGGLLVGLVGPVAAAPATADRSSAGPRLPPEREPLAAWLRIGPDGAVMVYTGKVEMGQGIRTSLAQSVAEELALDPARVQMVMGDTDLSPWDRGTHGSQSTPMMGSRLRLVAATAREILCTLAATQWNVAADTLVVENGRVVDRQRNRFLPFGTLAGRQDRAAVIDAEVVTSAPQQWTIAGKSVGKVDAVDVVTGRHTFVSDIHLPGLRHGKVLRPPSFGAELIDADVSGAAAMPGVVVVQDGNFVGVVADDPGSAEQALSRIVARWREKDHVDSAGLFDWLTSHPIEREGWGGRRVETQGAFERGFRSARRRLSARYTVPYIAHAPLEPRAAVAQWIGGKLLVWTGTQHPFPVRDDLAGMFGILPSRVRVRVPDTGSGYGGKHTAEVAIEAARLAKSGPRPVKVVWTREEEFTWAYFRPAGVIEIDSGFDGQGRLTAWQHVNTNSGAAGIATPYRIPHQKIVFQPADSPARQGSYRALATTANTFARESHMDEVAAAIGSDPLAFRRRHLDAARLRAVLDAGADRFRWSWTARQGTGGRGIGHALAYDKGGYVATFAEVSVGPGGRLDILRLVTAFECGAIVNPDNLENQIEGAVIMGLGGALFEAIELRSGRVVNDRFSRYRVPRFADVPPMETVLVDRRDLDSAGAGETPIVAVAPAIANAVFHATGARLRSLPLAPNGKVR